MTTENTTESSNPSGFYTHLLDFITGNLHRYADRELWITWLFGVLHSALSLRAISHRIAREPDCRGAVKLEEADCIMRMASAHIKNLSFQS